MLPHSLLISSLPISSTKKYLKIKTTTTTKKTSMVTHFIMNKFPILPLFILLILPFNSFSTSIHDLLKSQGLPGGLFPKNVKSFTLDQDGLLEVYFNEPCEAKFETLVRFDSVVKANLSFGGLNGVQGLSQEELFLWLPVKDIIVKDPSSGVILFNIGVAQKQLAFSLFEDPPVCNPHRSYIQMLIGRKEGPGIQQLWR